MDYKNKQLQNSVLFKKIPVQYDIKFQIIFNYNYWDKIHMTIKEIFWDIFESTSFTDRSSV